MRITLKTAAEDRDVFLAVPFGLAGLLCFALSFTLKQPDGRPVLFAVLLIVCLACLWLSKNRLALAAALVIFISIRVAWALLSLALTSAH
jgi:hypothetical protein